MDAVVLAAGQGTRMGPLTERRPKPLLPIADTTLIDNVIETIAPVVDHCVVVTGYHGTDIKTHLGASHAGVDLSYVDQPKQQGTADAVRVSREHVDSPCLVVNGDIVVEPSSIAAVAEADAPAMLGTTVENPTEYGVLSTNDGTLVDLVEKPEDPPSNLANAGVYLLDEAILDELDNLEPSERGEYELTDAIDRRLTAGDDIAVVAHDGFWHDVGYPWDLLTATEWLLADCETEIRGDVHETATLEGPVVVESGATVLPGSVIEGPAYIGPEATVGPNAYVRDGTVIREGAKVGHAVEVKRSLFFPGATASHLSYVGDSVLGADVNLGAGTTVANLRHDDKNVQCYLKEQLIDTGQRKFGIVAGDEVKTGINTSINAGVVLHEGATTTPGEVVLRNP